MLRLMKRFCDHSTNGVRLALLLIGLLLAYHQPAQAQAQEEDYHLFLPIVQDNSAATGMTQTEAPATDDVPPVSQTSTNPTLVVTSTVTVTITEINTPTPTTSLTQSIMVTTPTTVTTTPIPTTTLPLSVTVVVTPTQELIFTATPTATATITTSPPLTATVTPTVTSVPTVIATPIPTATLLTNSDQLITATRPLTTAAPLTITATPTTSTAPTATQALPQPITTPLTATVVLSDTEFPAALSTEDETPFNLLATTLPVVDHCGAISANQSWATGKVHRITCDVTVNAGVTLTVQAGAVVKFEGTGLLINGALRAAGSATNGIVFTSIKDDAYGGDTNGDGTVSTPAAGNWTTITTAGRGNATLLYTRVQYGGSCCNTGMIYATGNSVVIRNSMIMHSLAYGIQATAGSLAVTSSTIANNNADGIYLNNFNLGI